MPVAEPLHRTTTLRRRGSDPELACLLSATLDGDPSAFAGFYDATSRMVFGIVSHVVREHAQVEEVVQEVYLEIWRTASRCDLQRGTVGAWTNVIAHRRAVDRVRSAGRTAMRDQRYHRDLPVDACTAEELAISGLEATDVHAALAGLSEAQRAPLILAYFDGRTHREIAELLRLPLGTVKTRIRDGLRHLREQPGLQPPY